MAFENQDVAVCCLARQAAGRAYNVQAFLLTQTALEETMGADASPPLEDLRVEV